MDPDTTSAADAAALPPSFDLGTLRSASTAEMHLRHPITQAPLGWAWTIAGPGHDATVKLQNEFARDRLIEEKAKEQARVNGKKWKSPETSAEEERAKFVRRISRRVLGFPPCNLNGEKLIYSPEAVFKLLNDEEFGWLFTQLVEFLGEDASFIKGSATS